MRDEIDAFDVIIRVKDMWFKNIKTYLLPSLEVLLARYFLSMITFFLMIFMQFFIIIPLILITEYEMLILVPVVIFIIILTYLILLGVVVIGNSVVLGGASKIAKRLLDGEEYEFLDILKEGWKNIKDHASVFLWTIVFNYIVMFSILFLLVLVTAVSALSILVHPFLLIIPIITGSIGLVLFYMVAVFLIPLPYLSFVYHNMNDTGGFRSTLGSLSFMRRNKRPTFVMGGVLYIIQLMSSMVGGLSVIVAAFMTIFAHQCGHILLDEDQFAG